VKYFVHAPLKVKSDNSSLFIKPKELQYLFHDLMEQSAQIIINIKKGQASQRPYLQNTPHWYLMKPCASRGPISPVSLKKYSGRSLFNRDLKGVRSIPPDNLRQLEVKP
jgi:hypothetical protein